MVESEPSAQAAWKAPARAAGGARHEVDADRGAAVLAGEPGHRAAEPAAAIEHRLARPGADQARQVVQQRGMAGAATGDGYEVRKAERESRLGHPLGVPAELRLEPPRMVWHRTVPPDPPEVPGQHHRIVGRQSSSGWGTGRRWAPGRRPGR